MVNIEIKARCSDPDRIREILKSRNARFIGLDHQIDTYFKVEVGKRLKLRHGNIENSLIFYEREEAAGPKRSEIILVSDPPAAIKDILSKILGIIIVVDKNREIYFIEDNVKIHIDTVQGLDGFFVEIEAIDKDGTIGAAKLLDQCKTYLDILKITEEQLVSESYSDLLM